LDVAITCFLNKLVRSFLELPADCIADRGAGICVFTLGKARMKADSAAARFRIICGAFRNDQAAKSG
jgi:hypothetical protein